MTIVAVSMVRDEEDIVEHTVRHIAAQVDRVMILNNLSTDGTGPLLHMLAAELPVDVIPDPQLAYFQSRKLSDLAARAADEHGATWIVPFDADEVIVINRPWRDLRDLLASTDADELVVPWINHRPTTSDDQTEPNPLRRMVWREPRPEALAKVIVRWKPGLTIAQGNHSAWYAYPHQTAAPEGIAVHHFPMRSPEQLYRKVINGVHAYKAAGRELPHGAGIHWKQLYPRFRRHGLRAAADEFAAQTVHDPLLAGLVLDPVLP